MKTIRLIVKICKVAVSGFLAVLLFLGLVGIAKRVFLHQQVPLILGYGNAVIVSGSMEPAIAIGDIVIIQEQDDYDVGDIVTYRSNSSITHRIVVKTPTGYITQGDANNTPDREIEHNRVIGKVVRIIPRLGNIVLFLQSTFGMLMLIAGIVFVELTALFLDKIQRFRERRLPRCAGQVLGSRSKNARSSVLRCR